MLAPVIAFVQQHIIFILSSNKSSCMIRPHALTFGKFFCVPVPSKDLRELLDREGTAHTPSWTTVRLKNTLLQACRGSFQDRHSHGELLCLEERTIFCPLPLVCISTAFYYNTTNDLQFLLALSEWLIKTCHHRFV